MCNRSSPVSNCAKCHQSHLGWRSGIIMSQFCWSLFLSMLLNLTIAVSKDYFIRKHLGTKPPFPNLDSLFTWNFFKNSCEFCYFSKILTMEFIRCHKKTYFPYLPHILTLNHKKLTFASCSFGLTWTSLLPPWESSSELKSSQNLQIGGEIARERRRLGFERERHFICGEECGEGVRTVGLLIEV